MSIYTKRKIGHDEARTVVERLVNSHFRREPSARVGIPARPDYDDDLLIYAYIKQQEETPDNARRAWVREWRRKNGGHSVGGARGHALKLLEEVIELCVAAGACTVDLMGVLSREVTKAQARGEIGAISSAPKFAEECADVAMCLDVVVQECSIDLDAAVNKKIPVLEERQWQPDGDGVLRRPR